MRRWKQELKGKPHTLNKMTAKQLVKVKNQIFRWLYDCDIDPTEDRVFLMIKMKLIDTLDLEDSEAEELAHTIILEFNSSVTS